MHPGNAGFAIVLPCDMHMGVVQNCATANLGKMGLWVNPPHQTLGLNGPKFHPARAPRSPHNPGLVACRIDFALARQHAAATLAGCGPFEPNWPNILIKEWIPEPWGF